MNSAILKVFGLYVFAFAFLFGSKAPHDADVWFHLKTGQYILETASIPRTEMFSFTNFGVPFVAHGWLSGLLFYSIHSRLGFFPIMFGLALLAAIAFWVTFKRCRSHPLVAGFATLLATWAALPALGIRPRVFTLFLASVFLALLGAYAREGKGRRIWWLVPLMALWVNLHGGFLIGFALIGATIVGVGLDAWLRDSNIRSAWPRVKVLTGVLLGCVAAGLVNPYGLRMYTFPLRVMSSSVFQDNVIDWRSPNFHEPHMFPFALLILMVIAVVSLSPKRIRPSELFLLLGTMYATLKANRHLMMFTLVAAPILAEHLQVCVASSRFARIITKPTIKASPRATFVSVLLLLPLVLLGVRLKSTVYGEQNQKLLGVPINAVEYLAANQLHGNTFTDPNVWGAYVFWKLKNNPVYTDGRDVYPESFVKEYVDIIQGRADWRDPFDRYGVDIALLRQNSMLTRELRASSEWRQVYEDELSVVFKRSELLSKAKH
jgi:hypothetical protein